jgi:serine protease AprX
MRFMRQGHGSNGSTRSSALWGKPSKGDTRSSALWGKGGRGFAALVVLVLALVAPSTAWADAFVPQSLLDQAAAEPAAKLHVIIVGAAGVDGGLIKNELMKDARGNQFGDVRREFKYALDAVAADVTGRELLMLADKAGIRSVTPDAPVHAVGYAPVELWPASIGANGLWGTATSPAPRPPAIAIIDTGVDKDRAADFGGRVVQSVDFASLRSGGSDSDADYSGHGTMVAAIAAGSSPAYPGVAPSARIVSLRVMNSEGKAITSDVIAAVEWLFQNRRSYGVRVANFSLHSPYPNYGLYDPLNEAVRRLWLTGTVVVAAAGNTGEGRMLHAPASDPFVITVGATDINRTLDVADDKNAPWSGYGYTAEGFAKPELAAPGRYMAGPISENSQLDDLFPERVLARGYMWMSGTSFAAPVVAGAAAQILARHPDWTPDEVKGALMLTARPLPLAQPMSVGVGQIDVAAAAAVTSPPDANAAIKPFVGASMLFDVPRWEATVAADASWAQASWANASWASASWANASWANASWANASWASASWANASWANASWANASWANASWANASWANAGWAD